MDPSLTQGLFIIIVLIMSVVIHEIAHGYAALMQGDRTAQYQGRLTLNPIPHIDPLGSVILPLILVILPTSIVFGWAKPVPYNPYNLRDQRYGELKVALAGPLSNILIALVFGLGLRFLGPAGMLPDTAMQLMSFIVIINLVLAVFNMIPVPPLDGSKVLFTFLPARYQEVRAMLEQYGFFIVLFVILLLPELIRGIVIGLFRLITGLGFGF